MNLKHDNDAVSVIVEHTGNVYPPVKLWWDTMLMMIIPNDNGSNEDIVSDMIEMRKSEVTHTHKSHRKVTGS